MQNFLVILPPIIVLLLVFITKKIAPSLILGIASAAFIAKDYSIIKALYLIGIRFLNQIIDNYIAFVFTVFLGIIITLISKSGGERAFAKALMEKIKSPRAVEAATLILSLFFCIDDYLNLLTVGCSMRPLTDKFKLPRTKLAFLIDSMASPLCIITPISSWIIFLTIQINQSGVSLDPLTNPTILADPFKLYLKSIPFVFYSFIMIAAAWFIVINKMSYGTMKDQELIAKKTGNLFGGKDPINNKLENNSGNESMIDFLLPLLTLIVSVFILFRFHNIPFTKKLALASIIALAVSLISSIARKKLDIKDTPGLLLKGTKLILPSIKILILAWTFGSILKNDLHTGEYLAINLMGIISTTTLPLACFILSSLIALATGTTFGTITVMSPIAIPILASFLNLSSVADIYNVGTLLSVIGAILSGAVAGVHLSPISDTVTMSSIASGCYQIDHSRTFIPYVMPAIFGTMTAYIISGVVKTSLSINIISSLVTGIAVCWTMLLILNYLAKGKQ